MADEASDEPVPRLVEECLRLREDQGATAVEAFLARHPDRADAVRARLQALAQSGFLDDEDDASFPERLGEFRLLEKIGGGGMGVVYLAEQEPLGRRVALKLIRPEHLYFERSRERFRREIEAVSRLEHPGIVAVFTFGEQQGVPYYAMEYVVGLSLAQALDRLRGTPAERLSGDRLRGLLTSVPAAGSTSRDGLFDGGWVDVCFRIVEQIATALDHAHSRGILHRDVKPSNIMLTPDGRARLLDFGLARADDAAGITASGSLLGSLPYMAPEQVSGDRAAIDARTDVYALGVTLYELLTLRAPYQAVTAERTRQRILEGRPAPIERLNASVPWDAETVCLKAMAPERAQRYASMAAFAADVARFLRRESITARRPGVVLRTRRWAQRQPARATALVAGLIIAIGAPTAYAIQAEVVNAQLRAVNRRADLNLEDAIATNEAMLARGESFDLATMPGTDPTRRAMLEEVLAQYEKLLERERGSPRLMLSAIHAHVRVSAIRSELGDLDGAQAVVRTALELCDKAESDDPRRVAQLRARATVVLVRTMAWAGKVEEMREQCVAQLRELDAVERRFPDLAASLLVGRAELQGQLARAHARRGEGDLALAASRAAVELLERQSRDTPDKGRIIAKLAEATHSLAYFTAYFRRQEPSRSIFEAAIAHQRRALGLLPGPARRADLARMLVTWGQTEIWHKRWREAIGRTEEAVTLLDPLVRDHPQRVQYASNLLRSSHQLAYLRGQIGDLEAATAALVLTSQRGEKILANMSDVPEVVEWAAIVESELAAKLGVLRRFEEADRRWQRALELWQQLGSVEKESRFNYRRGISVMFDNQGRYERERGRLSRALELAERACAQHRELIARYPKERLYRRRLGKSLQLAATVLAQQGQPGQAVALLVETRDEAEHDWPSLVRELGAYAGGRADLCELVCGKQLRWPRPLLSAGVRRFP